MTRFPEPHAPNAVNAPTVLWWSRSGRDYSRDRIIRNAFNSLGWNIQDFRPKFSPLGDLEATFRKLPRPDVVWVPCFRQRDAAAAVRWARKQNIPVVIDPLISAWDKQVFERRKFSEGAFRAKRLRKWESTLLKSCSAVVADTSCHAEFFQSALGVLPERTAVIPVSAEEGLFPCQSPKSSDSPFHVMFYGSFIGLQGPQYIAEAARQVADVKWTFIGTGPLLDECQKIVNEAAHVEFVSRVPYNELANRIGTADVMLGVFGTSEKAGRVIPNKVYQAMACGRPVITRSSLAYPSGLERMPATECGLCWVNAGNAVDIATAVRQLASQPAAASEAGLSARRTFDRLFNNNVVIESLQSVLRGCCPSSGNSAKAA